MDITIFQIKNGTTQDLTSFKYDILDYLSNKKFSLKSKTLLNALKLINKELNIRRMRKYSLENVCSATLTGRELKRLEIPEIPSFLQDMPTKSFFLSRKRPLEETMPLLPVKKEQEKEKEDLSDFRLFFNSTKESFDDNEEDEDVFRKISQESGSDSTSCKSGSFSDEPLLVESDSYFNL